MKKLALTLAATGALFAGVVGQAQAAGMHTCNAGDPPITASMRTSCALGGAAVNEYANYGYCRRSYSEWIYSPRANKTYRVRFVRSGRTITVTGRNGIWMRFSSDPFC